MGGEVIRKRLPALLVNLSRLRGETPHRRVQHRSKSEKAGVEAAPEWNLGDVDRHWSTTGSMGHAEGMTRPEPRRCKILCTIGPASSSAERIGSLIEAGMSAARLNFSHGSHEDHARVYRTIREEASRRDLAVAIVADLQGPKIRVGKIPDPGFELAPDSTVIIGTGPDAVVTQDGDVAKVTTTFTGLPDEVKPGDPILLDDGNLELEVTSVEGRNVHAKVIQGGLLSSNKGINLPGSELNIPSLTEKDREDLAFAVELGVDFIALSFVRRADDIHEARALMEKMGRVCRIIAKIEKPQAIDNLHAIVDATDGIMVARGDLGVEMGPELVPIIQKRAIERANQHGKLVITATQMLDSMIRNPRPTRAEASDVANAVLDGSDAVMLSGETAVGAYPVRTVRTMAKIISSTEDAPRYWEGEPEGLEFANTTNAIARAAVSCSKSLPETQAIVTYTGSGGIARLVSDHRPRVPIYAFTPNPATYQALALNWGVIPVLFSPSSPGGESIFIDLDKALLSRGFLERGARVVITFGYPLKAHASVNLLKLHQVGETLG